MCRQCEMQGDHGQPCPVYEAQCDQWAEEREQETATLPGWSNLRIRLSHRYVGAHQDLDDWRDLGAFQELASGTYQTNPDDMCDPVQTIYLVAVETDQPEQPETIARALSNTFTYAGCAHEWDCCGCRSYYGQAEYLRGNRYQVTVHSSRNY